MIAAAVVGLLFGAADQYLGSLKPMVALGPWTVSVSQMSALWLLLPFVFGWREDRPRRAVVAGLVATACGLLGYLAMMLGPAEGLPASRIPSAAVAWVGSNVLVILGGTVTGPVFGWLGHRWRVSRWWPSAAVITGAPLLEPAARLASGHLLGPLWIWGVEMTLGVALVGSLVAVARRRPVPLGP